MLKLDIGGTNLRLYKDEILVNSQAIHGNINSNSNLINELIEYLSLQQITSNILIGIAGYYTCADKLKLELDNALKSNITNYQVVSDAEFHAMELICEDELLISLGTGSVASYYQDKEFKIIGGYGHVLGDVGSGYHFGKLCIINYMNDYEAEKELTYMKKIEEHYKTQGRAVLSKVISDEKRQCSELSKLFMDDDDFEKVFSVFFNQFEKELYRYVDLSQKQLVVINGSITKSVRFKKELKTLKLNIKIK